MMSNKYSQTKNNYDNNHRLQIIGTSRNYSNQKNINNKSDTHRFRMTHRVILNSGNNKKIKSQALSPDDRFHQFQTNANQRFKIRNLTYRDTYVDTQQSKNKEKSSKNSKITKNPSFRIEDHSQKKNIINFKSNIQTQAFKDGRIAGLSTQTPDKLKLRTGRLFLDANPSSIEKLDSKGKNAINSVRKYSYQNQLNENKQAKLSKELVRQSKQKLKNNIDSQSPHLTCFQQQQSKKFSIYYEGKRRINSKNQFTNLDGNSTIQIGDSIAYRYQILQHIGEGAFGKVYKSKDHKKNELVALKIIKAIPKLNKQAKIEIGILELAINQDKEFKNNIVRMKSSFVFRGHTCITYQILSINLYEYLKFQSFSSTPQQTIVKFAIQVLHALNFLHKHKIVHCDIKPENIMLKDPQKTGLRLIDFGSSCYQQQQYYTYIQSRYYRAPQIILGIKYTTAIDMWSFGCVLAELYTGYPLFPGQNEQQQLLMYIQLLGNPPHSMIEMGQRRKRFFNAKYQHTICQSSNFRLPKGLSFEKALKNCNNKLFVDFLKKCIIWQPNKRVSPKEALLDQWILSGIPQNVRARHIVEVTGQGINFQ